MFFLSLFQLIEAFVQEFLILKVKCLAIEQDKLTSSLVNQAGWTYYTGFNHAN